MSPDFIKSVIVLLHARLATLGFIKKKPGISITKISDETIGWIGTNKATRGKNKYLELNLVVGVRNQRIERLVAELVNEEFNDVIPPTLAGNIGYLMPQNEYCPYIFSEDNPKEMVVEKLTNDVRLYGLPFMQRHMGMDELINGMYSSRFAIGFMAAYRIPAGLFLLGRKDDAGNFLSKELTKLKDHNNSAALRYKKFAENFMDLFNKGVK